MLVPLFGLQLLLTIYRPDVGVEAERHMEYAAFAITNSQVCSRSSYIAYLYKDDEFTEIGTFNSALKCSE